MTEKKTKESMFFPLVGIGASAGGLEAFIELLKYLPENSGMAFIIIQHTLPEATSKLDDILSRNTQIPIRKITDGMKIEPNCIYIVPPDKSVKAEERVFRFQELAPTKEGGRNDINNLFMSLARDSHFKAIGILLSGTGADGVKGLMAIKEAGGITFAQNKESARFPDMPEAARLAGAADFILSPMDIGKEIARISEDHSAFLSKDLFSGKLKEEDKEGFNKITALLQKMSGVKFSEYRSTTLLRRINRRVLLHKKESLAKYADYLANHPEEIEALYSDILIGTTEFFREEESFTVLKQVVFSAITANRQGNEPIRVWVPGCSTGQEVYSLGITITEFLEEKMLNNPVLIFGTDINEASIDKARKGEYTAAEIQGISSSRLHYFFNKLNGKYKIKKSLRERCIFARHDILSDPPYFNIDLISCRNLLIYLTPALQKKVIPILHYALKTEGFLMLGSSESVDNFIDYFQPVNKRFKIYTKQKKQSTRYTGVAFPYLHKNRAIYPKSMQRPAEETDYAEKNAEQILMTDYLPGSILVDANWLVIKFWGHTSPYLEHSIGRASLHLKKMVKEEIFFDVQLALNEAQNKKTKIIKEGVSLTINNRKKLIKLEVIPIEEKADNYCFLIIFTETEEAEKIKGQQSAAKAEEIGSSAEETKIQQLKNELKRAEERLASFIDKEKTTNEHLYSALEELQSSNEELQSTNEELETSKEELQSTNEELNTVNEELSKQNVMLDKTNNDLINLLASIDIPVVMLDKNLRIRLFNAPAKTSLNLIDADEGRKFTDLNVHLGSLNDLKKIFLDVIQNVKEEKKEIRDIYNRWHLLQVKPYKTLENKVEGVVIVLVDIDELKRALENYRLLVTVVRDSNDAVIIQDFMGTIKAWNKGGERIYGWEEQDILGKNVNIIIPDEQAAQYQKLLKSISEGKEIKSFETKRKTKSGQILDIWITASKLTDETGKIIALATTERDITDRNRNQAIIMERETKFREYFDNSPEYSFIVSKDLNIIDVNKSACLALGYDKQELTGNLISNVYKGDSSHAVMEILTKLQGNNVNSYNKELQLLTRSGEKIPVVLHAARVMGPAENAYYYILINISLKTIKETEILKEDKKSLEKIINERVKELAAAKRLVDIGTLSATVAHELRNPLAAIAAAVFNIERKASKKYLQKVQRSIDTINIKVTEANKIINNLLFYSRIRRPVKEPVPICQLLDETIEQTGKRRKQEPVTIVKKCFFPEEQVIMVDPLQIREVFENIIGNSYDALTGNKGKIKIAIKPDKAGFAAIIISDNGPGIDPLVLNQIFDPFFSTKSKGTGLGLSVSRQIVEKHGGDINIESEIGKGTTVKIVLPLPE